MAALKKTKIVFQGQLSLNAGQKYCRMFQGEPSAILSTFIKLPFVIKIFVLSIFETPFYRSEVFIEHQPNRIKIREELCTTWFSLYRSVIFCTQEFTQSSKA